MLAAPTPRGWSGESGHQRLFVAAAELLRACRREPHGVLLTIDDFHDADEASVRLLHYLARAATRPARGDRRSATGRSRVGHARRDARQPHRPPRRSGARPRAPRPRRLRTALVARHVAEPDHGVWSSTSTRSPAACPFAVDELARRAADEPAWVQLLDVNMIGGIAPATREVLQRVAVVGTTFDTDEFVALCGSARGRGLRRTSTPRSRPRVVEPTGVGLPVPPRPGPRRALGRPPSTSSAAHPSRCRDRPRRARRVARPDRLPPAAAGEPLGRPVLLRAAETAAAMGAYRDALDLVEAVRAHATRRLTAPRLLRSCAPTCSMAIGDPTAIAAYREALEAAAPTSAAAPAGAPGAGRDDVRRSRRPRRPPSTGSTPTAAPTTPRSSWSGPPGVSPVRLRHGLGRLRGARSGASSPAIRAGRCSTSSSLQGLLAHQRGEWFDRMRFELRRTRDAPEVANAIFDGYLCAAEYVLYGPTPVRRGHRASPRHCGRPRSAAARCGPRPSPPRSSAKRRCCPAISSSPPRAARGRRPAPRSRVGRGEAHSLQRLAEVHLASATAARQCGCCGRRCRWRVGRWWRCTCCNGSTAR